VLRLEIAEALIAGKAPQATLRQEPSTFRPLSLLLRCGRVTAACGKAPARWRLKQAPPEAALGNSFQLRCALAALFAPSGVRSPLPRRDRSAQWTTPMRSSRRTRCP
jgi:hypothetical protein